MLTRRDLIELAEHRYFDGCNNHDLATVLKTMSPECLMKFSAAKYTYIGEDALRTHFKDFMGNFPTINFHDYVSVVDVESQSIATHFTVTLTDKNNDDLIMKNCNFFVAGQSGQFDEVYIFNASPLKAGFEAGSAS